MTRTFVQAGIVLAIGAGLAAVGGVAWAAPTGFASLPVADSSPSCFHFENPGIGVYRRVGDLSVPDPCPVAKPG